MAPILIFDPAPSANGVEAPSIRFYRVKQICAKSRHDLSSAWPAIFIFCHSSPHACMRWREAAGKGPVAPAVQEATFGFGATGGGACGFAGAAAGGGGAPASAEPASILAGRAGGRGATAGGFGLVAESCAKAPVVGAAAAATQSAADRQSAAPLRPKAPRANADNRRALSIRSITTRPRAIHCEADMAPREPTAAKPMS